MVVLAADEADLCACFWALETEPQPSSSLPSAVNNDKVINRGFSDF